MVLARWALLNPAGSCMACTVQRCDTKHCMKVGVNIFFSRYYSSNILLYSISLFPLNAHLFSFLPALYMFLELCKFVHCRMNKATQFCSIP